MRPCRHVVVSLLNLCIRLLCTRDVQIEPLQVSQELHRDPGPDWRRKGLGKADYDDFLPTPALLRLGIECICN